MTQTLEHPTAIDRLDIYKVAPELYDAMMKLSTASAKGVDPTVGEL
ncbi:MAG: carboxymuconolactone decarboxylase family protein, partial [Mycobacterium sp.]